jgi:heat shock protein HspQ
MKIATPVLSHHRACIRSLFAAAAAAVWSCSQPFYHLLVEVSDWGYDASQPPVAYVAQELLAAPEVEDDGATWTQVGSYYII